MAFTFKHGDRPLDGYTIQRGIGRGGFGEVYYAVSDGGREVALKYLRENPQIELRGVSQCMNLKSPHLISIFDVRQNQSGDYFIIMEYVPGPSLRDILIAEPNGLGVQKASFFFRELGKGLSYLHDRGIVHRDLKPGNIFYDEGYVKIGDYGLSKFISVSRHSAQTASVGTVHYMAPEIGSGNYHRGIDIYALGVILYEMLLGRVPFEGSTMGEVLMKHLTEQPEVANLPEPFGRVIPKALAKDPAERYQTVDAMMEEIFAVEDIKQSVANYQPASLETLVRGVELRQMPSPAPSPNPPPRAIPIPPPPPPIAPLRPIPRMVTDPRAHDFDGGRPGGPSFGPEPGRGPVPVVPVVPTDRAARLPRIVSAGLVALAIAMGATFISAGKYREFYGVYSFAMIFACTAGALLSRGLSLSWLNRCGTDGGDGRSAASGACGPNWLMQRLIVVGSCAPFILVIALIFGRTGFPKASSYVDSLLICMFVLDWSKRVKRGLRGDLRLWDAIVAGFVGAVVGGMMHEGSPSPFMAGIMAAASLMVESLATLLPVKYHLAANEWGSRSPITSPATPAPFPPAVHGPAPVYDRPSPRQAADREPGSGSPLGAVGGPQAKPAAAPPTWDEGDGIRRGIPLGTYTPGASMASKTPLQPLRHWAARAFWLFWAFVFLAGGLSCFVVAVIVNWRRAEELHGVVAGCVALLSFSIFAFRKGTLRQRFGFWRETARPFLTAASMSILGLAISALAILPMDTDDEEFIMAIVGIVFGSIGFLASLFLKGRGAPPSKIEPAPISRERFESETPAGNGTKQSDASGRPVRHWAARAFWLFWGFALLAGGVSCLIVAIACEWPNHEDLFGFVAGCVALLSFSIFAFRKATRHKRSGIWRETGRPLLTAVSMSVLGLALSAFATVPLGRDQESFIAAIVGLVFGSIGLLVSLFAGGRAVQSNKSDIRPFLVPRSGGLESDEALIAQNRN